MFDLRPRVRRFPSFPPNHWGTSCLGWITAPNQNPDTTRLMGLPVRTAAPTDPQSTTPGRATRQSVLAVRFVVPWSVWEIDVESMIMSYLDLPTVQNLYILVDLMDEKAEILHSWKIQVCILYQTPRICPLQILQLCRTRSAADRRSSVLPDPPGRPRRADRRRAALDGKPHLGKPRRAVRSGAAVK